MPGSPKVQRRPRPARTSTSGVGAFLERPQYLLHRCKMAVLRALVFRTCPLLTSPCFSLFPFVFFLQTSTSAVTLNSQGLWPGSSLPLPCTLPSPPPPSKSSLGDHTPEVLCTEGNSQVLLPSLTPKWLGLGGLEETSDTQKSRYPVAASQPSCGVKSQAQVRHGLMDTMGPLSRAPPCHTPHPAGSTESQGPLGNLVCSEENGAPIWRQPQALTASEPESPHGVTYSFQEGLEPPAVAVDRQTVFPDTWGLTKECALQERAQSEPGGLGSTCPIPGDKEQPGTKISQKGNLRGPTGALENPGNPEGATEATLEVRKEQPELPHAMAMGPPSISERISTSGQAGTSLFGH